ncbi:MAG: glycosyltransferase family 4 protein [Promethearchaeota archaeon]
MPSILYLPTRYFPAISGAELYFQRIAEILTKRYNYNIDIFTSNAIDFKALRNPSGKTISVGNKFFYRVNSLKINRFPVSYIFEITEIINNIKHNSIFQTLDLSDDCIISYINNGPYLPDLLDYFHTNTVQYDLIHTTFYPYFNNLIALYLSRLLEIPVVITPFFHFSNPRYNNLNLMEILKEFDSIIACTNSEKIFLTNKLSIKETKISVIPMGVDYNKFNTPSLYSFKKKYFKIKEQNYKMILFCGYKNYEKGAISILKAIPKILKKIKNIYFVFIGPPTQAFNRELSKVQKVDNAKIINLTPDNLTGYFDRKKIAAFQETDIFIMPSRSDAFGIAFLEAWAAGKPVIGANIGATPEVISSGKDGILVEFDNPEDLAFQIIKLIKKSKLRKRLGRTGQNKVFNHFTWDKITEKTHNLYKQIIN